MAIELTGLKLMSNHIATDAGALDPVSVGGNETIQQLIAHNVGNSSVATHSVGNDGLDSDGSFVMQMYDIRRQYLSDRINNCMTGLQSITDQQRLLGNIQNALGQMSNGNENDDGATKEKKFKSVMDALKQADALLPEGEAKTQVHEMLSNDGNMINAGHDNIMSAEEVKQASDLVTKLQSGLDTDSQRATMLVNELMGEKQEMSTLFAGIIANNHSSNMAVLNNIGH